MCACELTHVCIAHHALWVFWPRNHTASQAERPLEVGMTGSLRFGGLWLQMTETQTLGTKTGILQAHETDKIRLQVQPGHSVTTTWFLLLSFLARLPLTWRHTQKVPAALGSHFSSRQKDRASLPEHFGQIVGLLSSARIPAHTSH